MLRDSSDDYQPRYPANYQSPSLHEDLLHRIAKCVIAGIAVLGVLVLVLSRFIHFSS